MQLPMSSATKMTLPTIKATPRTPYCDVDGAALPGTEQSLPVKPVSQKHRGALRSVSYAHMPCAEQRARLLPTGHSAQRQRYIPFKQQFKHTSKSEKKPTLWATENGGNGQTILAIVLLHALVAEIGDRLGGGAGKLEGQLSRNLTALVTIEVRQCNALAGVSGCCHASR
jgi:hypothetical protein